MSSSAVVLLASDVEAMLKVFTLVFTVNVDEDVALLPFLEAFTTVEETFAADDVLLTMTVDFQLIDDDEQLCVVEVELLALPKIDRCARLDAIGVFGGAGGFDALFEPLFIPNAGDCVPATFLLEETGCCCCVCDDLITDVKAEDRITLFIDGVPPTLLAG